jgi:hypothetical protein
VKAKSLDNIARSGGERQMVMGTRDIAQARG